MAIRNSLRISEVFPTLSAMACHPLLRMDQTTESKIEFVIPPLTPRR